MQTEEVFRLGDDFAETQILLVDDNPHILDVLNLLFKAQGWKCVSASNVTEAIQVLDLFEPDLIVSDLLMPGHTGYILYDHIKKDSRYIDLPFIFLTAATGSNLKIVALEQGCEAYLTKPFDPAELTSMVRGQIAKSKKRKSIREKLITEDRRRVIQTLSHEFRTPLVSINTGSELILENGQSLNDEQVRKLIESIWRGGKRLEKLVADFLVLQQISQGLAKKAAQKYKDKVNLKEILERSVKDFLDGQRGALPNIVIEPLTEDAEVEVYQLQIVDAIGRLIENSLKYCSGDRTIFISYGLTDQQSCTINIRDFGIGVNELRHLVSSMDSIFNQHDRNILEQQGCGFGLFIVNQFVKYNGGTFNIMQPVEGPGLEAVIEFPLVDLQTV